MKVVQETGRILPVEKNIEEQFDKVTVTIAKSMGIQTIPWFKFTYYLTCIYAACTVLVMFYRSDFFNMNICVVALYMLLNNERITHYTFRMLVFAVFISLIYDLIWFAMKASEYSTESKNDSGMEKNVKRFSLYMSYISFFIRLLVALVYWKASLDFDSTF